MSLHFRRIKTSYTPFFFFNILRKQIKKYPVLKSIYPNKTTTNPTTEKHFQSDLFFPTRRIFFCVSGVTGNLRPRPPHCWGF